MNGRGWLGIVAVGLALHPAAGLDVVITRHAETLANVTKVYSAFNQRHFSEQGARQIEAFTGALGDRRFDAILVSPAYRGLKTIEPYLARAGVQAEIWPELDECCWIPEGRGEKTPPPEPILLEPEQRALFVLRADADAWTAGDETYAEGVTRAGAAAALLLERWRGRESVILVMTHQHTGARLVEKLLGQSPIGRYKLENARFTHLREEAGGRFRLMRLNGATPPPLNQPAGMAAP